MAALEPEALDVEADNGIRTVEDVVARLTENGTKLALTGRRNGNAGARIVAAALPQCPALRTLCLQSNSIGAEGASALAAALPQCTALQTLNLGNNSIGAEGASALAAALPLCTALQTLHLQYNSVGDEGARALAAALPQCTALQTLDLYNNSIGAEGASALAAALPQCTGLQTLVLSNNSICADGARALAAALPQCTALQTLHLHNNSIGADGARALAAALPQCTALQTLNLRWNRIGADGVHALAAALPQCTALQTLNGISVESARALATALPQCTALQTLDLYNNTIGAEGARALAAALPQCTALQTLNLGWNSIGVDGAHVLAAVLPQCTALQTLDLSGNGVDDALLAEIEAILAQNQDRYRQAATTESAASESAPAVEAAPLDAQSSLPAFLVKRREDDAYAPARDALATKWAPTAIDLFTCPACMRRIDPGQSVLLDKCLHSICRDCAPHMLQADSSIKCAHCHIVSTVVPSALPPHPVVETKLTASDAHDCSVCLSTPDEDDRLPAAFKCADCDRKLCEAHTATHRRRMPTHVIAHLPHGGAPLRCTTHPEHPIKAYCTACRTLVCLECLASTHPAATHATRLLTETAFVEAARARLVEGIAKVRAAVTTVIDQGTDATVAVKEVADRDAAIRDEVDRTINALIAYLEQRRETMHAHCAERSNKDLASLKTTREETEHNWRLMTSAADLAEQLATGAELGVNATALMVQLEAAATARLAAVLDLVPANPVPAPVTLHFTFDESVGQKLAALGEIVEAVATN